MAYELMTNDSCNSKGMMVNRRLKELL